MQEDRKDYMEGAEITILKIWWGVAWSLDESFSMPHPKDMPSTLKKKTPFSYTYKLDIENTWAKLQQLLSQLQITFLSLKNNAEVKAVEITAISNTWANSRRKRRQEKFKQQISKNSINNENSKDDTTYVSGIYNEPDDNDSHNIINNDIKSFMETSDSSRVGKRQALNKDETETVCAKKMKTNHRTEESDSKNEVFLYASLVVKKMGQDSLIELCWLRGAGGRDAAHQVLQYFKNNLDNKTS